VQLHTLCTFNHPAAFAMQTRERGVSAVTVNALKRHKQAKCKAYPCNMHCDYVCDSILSSLNCITPMADYREKVAHASALMPMEAQWPHTTRWNCTKHHYYWACDASARRCWQNISALRSAHQRSVRISISVIISTDCFIVSSVWHLFINNSTPSTWLLSCRHIILVAHTTVCTCK